MAEKESPWKYIPIVAGLLIGWAIFNPPPFLRELGISGYISMFLLLAVLFLVLCAVMIHVNLPKDVVIRRSASPLPGEVTRLGEELKALGFTQTSDVPLSVNVAPPALVVPFVNEQDRTYGAVYKTDTIPPKIMFDLVSIFEGNRGGLTSGTLAEGAAMPGLGSMKQVFPRGNVKAVYDKHREALDYLRSRGIQCRTVNPQTFERDFRDSMLRLRKSFLTSPVMFTLTVLWRAVTKKTPHTGSIRQQSVAQQQIQDILTGKTIPPVN